MEKPNCYECKHRGNLPGDAHSCCEHPEAGGKSKDALGEVFAIFASVGRMAPMINFEAAKKLGVRGNLHGVRNGWFNWPYNFDPTWLEQCSGFEAKKPAPQDKTSASHE